jgi:hypothetical protein
MMVSLMDREMNMATQQQRRPVRQHAFQQELGVKTQAKR